MEDFGAIQDTLLLLGVIPAGKWESLGTRGLDGVLEYAQGCSTFPDPIPSKWPFWDGWRAGQRSKPVVLSADLSVVCPLANQSSSTHSPGSRQSCPGSLRALERQINKSHRGSISRSLSPDRLRSDSETPDGAASTGTSCGQCEGASQTPLATEKLLRQMLSVFCGTEHGDASLAVSTCLQGQVWQVRKAKSTETGSQCVHSVAWPSLAPECWVLPVQAWCETVGDLDSHTQTLHDMRKLRWVAYLGSGLLSGLLEKF